jgi:hypothetical protein
MAALLRAAALLVLVGVPAVASAAADHYPAARLMSSAERQAQVARRNAICNASVVVASCWGFDPADSTEFLQAALDSGARKVIIPPMCDDSYADCPTSQSTGDHKWITTPLHVRSNTVILLQVGVQLWAKRWEYTAHGSTLLNLDYVSNVDIIGYGATVQMWKQDYAYRPGAPQQGNGTCLPGVGLPCNYSKAEWRHGIQLTEAENVTITGLTVSSSGGDGIGIGGTEMTYPSAACTAAHRYPSCHTPAILKQGGCCRVSVSRNVHIKDVVSTNNYRQGMSVTGAINLLVEDSVFELTGGTAPMCGVSD